MRSHRFRYWQKRIRSTTAARECNTACKDMKWGAVWSARLEQRIERPSVLHGTELAERDMVHGRQHRKIAVYRSAPTNSITAITILD